MLRHLRRPHHHCSKVGIARISSLEVQKTAMMSTSTTSFASAPARPDLACPELFTEKMYINGKLVPSSNSATLKVTDPATGAFLGTIPMGTAADAEKAIACAREAQAKWATYPVAERCAIVKKWGQLMMKHQDDLGKILTAEQGKPLVEAHGEIAYAAGFLDFFGDYGVEGMKPDTIASPSADVPVTIKAIKAPVGVVAAITPWNFPSAMITRKAGPALVAGCSIVIKPSELTPYSAFALAILAEQAGVPPGVFNVVTGDAAEIGNTFTSSTLVDKITFTGSTRVGKLLMSQSANTVKRMSMELGGNAPFIVFEDADLGNAVTHAVAAKLRNAGQTCVTPNRFFVQTSVYDAFVDKMTEAFKKVKVGHGFAEGVNVGPLINEQAALKVDGIVKDALSKGAVVKVGASGPLTLPTPPTSATASSSSSDVPKVFYSPTILTNVTPSMKCFQEEIFGPVAPIFKFNTEDEAIDLANSTRAGLASYFFSKSADRIDRVITKLQYGMVAANQGSVSSPIAPFGGVKESGIGREGSKYGLDEYVYIKGVHDRQA